MSTIFEDEKGLRYNINHFFAVFKVICPKAMSARRDLPALRDLWVLLDTLDILDPRETMVILDLPVLQVYEVLQGSRVQLEQALPDQRDLALRVRLA
jgi:hypothetical protein